MEKKKLLHLQDCSIYQQNKEVLKEVNLELHSGQFMYLIGETGSGKSSLLKTLYGDLELKKGKGEVTGYKLHKLHEKEIPYLRRNIGIVFQDFQLLTDRNVYHNLLFVLKATGWKEKDKMNTRIQEVLKSVGMEGKIAVMPHQLSGGEQQRVSIARALLNNPPLILADEPTGNLDPSTSEEIIILMRDLVTSGRSVLMATHDYSIILKYPSLTYKCYQGKMFATLNASM